MSAFGTLQVGSALSYLIALVIPALDAIFPVLPGETVVIALGVVTAGSTDPRIALLVGCAAAAATVCALWAGTAPAFSAARRERATSNLTVRLHTGWTGNRAGSP